VTSTCPCVRGRFRGSVGITPPGSRLGAGRAPCPPGEASVAGRALWLERLFLRPPLFLRSSHLSSGSQRSGALGRYRKIKSCNDPTRAVTVSLEDKYQMSAEKASSEGKALLVQVPYLLNEPTTLAEKELKSVGLSWKISGSTRQPNYVKSQNPEPGKSVPRGTVVDLFCETGPTP
jgi:hypothetical protein